MLEDHNLTVYFKMCCVWWVIWQKQENGIIKYLVTLEVKIWLLLLLLLLTIRAAAPTQLHPEVCEGNRSCESGISCSHEGNRRSAAACWYVRLFMCVCCWCLCIMTKCTVYLCVGVLMVCVYADYALHPCVLRLQSPWSVGLRCPKLCGTFPAWSRVFSPASILWSTTSMVVGAGWGVRGLP